MPFSLLTELIEITEATFEIEEGTRITAQTLFDDLDFDSLVLVELAVILQKRYGIAVSDEELAEAESFGATADLLDAKLSAVPLAA